jgi:hypothetical protein
MHVFLQLKSYSEYFDLLMANKKKSEWDSAFNTMRDNKELETFFKDQLKKEMDEENIIFILSTCWNYYKDNFQSRLNSVNKLINLF